MPQLQNTLIYVHMTLHNLPTCDMSLGFPIVGVPEAGGFVGSLVLYVHSVNLVANPYNQCSSCIIRSVRVKSCPRV
jgi:phosphomevalonate kinase